jgi:O-acetyl-ADP-ribose deacetylase (regulator of RNase III)
MAKFFEMKGDLLQIAKDLPLDVIMHQVNCLGVMGGGIALQIKNKYPRCFKEYADFCSLYNFSASRGLLGKHYVYLEKNLDIINLFGQNGFASEEQPQATNYAALETALSSAIKRYSTRGGSPFKIGLPKNMGCGLAGGDWKVVGKIIHRVFEPTNHSVFIVEFDPNVLNWY